MKQGDFNVIKKRLEEYTKKETSGIAKYDVAYYARKLGTLEGVLRNIADLYPDAEFTAEQVVELINVGEKAN